MMLMFPDASIPIVSLSLYSSQDAAAHITAGEALQPLRDEGVLIVGSGASFHNFKHMFAPWWALGTQVESKLFQDLGLCSQGRLCPSGPG